VNAVVLFRIPGGETPQGLLAKLQALEWEFGRLPKRVHNEARPLDLDLVAFGALRMYSETLTLPHPRATQRRFVMQPLAEIAPDLRLPGNSLTASEIVARLA
jgi:2-amino-4-hydroxy-6-hydroxymethyldihydropteridine diphosphokinase